MYKTIKQISKLQFPLYAIPSDNWDEIDGMVYVDGRLLDNLNNKGSSIGIRRLQMRRPKDELYPLKGPVRTIGDLIKSKRKHFISSCGTPFTYIKTGFQHVKYHLIKKYDYRDTFTFVWLEGISLPIQIPRPPSDINFISWARILYIGDFPWMVYEYSKRKGKDTRIKV